MKIVFLLAAITFLFFSFSAFADGPPAPAGKKLFHVVSLKYKEGTTPEQIKAVDEAFAALKTKIPGISSLHWGDNVSPEKHDHGYTQCFVLTFATAKDRDAYLVHPEHKAFGALLGPVMSDVMVLDFWADDDSAAKPAGENSVGVVDLDRVGLAMGWNDEMRKNLEETKTQIGGQLKDYLKHGTEKFEARKREIANAAALSTAEKEKLNNAKSRADLEKLALTPAQIDELLQAVAVVQNEAANASQRLNQIIQQQKQEIVKAYQDAAQPSIRRVASANNLQVVFQPIGALYTDPRIDVTDKVVDDLQHVNGGKVELPPVPKLDIPISDKAK